jgi:hypothetical protein
LEKVATKERASVSRPRTSNAQRDPTRDQHDTDEWRNPFPVTGLNSEGRIPDRDALCLGLGNGHDQGSNTGNHQEQAGKQQKFPGKSSTSTGSYPAWNN